MLELSGRSLITPVIVTGILFQIRTSCPNGFLSPNSREAVVPVITAELISGKEADGKDLEEVIVN